MSRLLSPRILLPLVGGAVVVAVVTYFIPPVVLPLIQLPAEPVLHVFGLPITNTLIATWLAMAVLILLSFFGTRNMKMVPSGLQNVLEYVVGGLYGLAEDLAGPKWARHFFPIIMTIFLLLVVSNWMGILPFFGSVGLIEPAHEGVRGQEIQQLTSGIAVLTAQEAEEGHGYVLVPFLRSAATDVNLPLALAVISVALTQYFGVKALGLKYFKKFFAVSFKQGLGTGIVDFFVGILELISEFAKIISFTFRLFGNVFAGEILLAVMAFLIPYVASIPFYGLELFIGFIQAFVFMMLTLVFFTLAILAHESH